MSKRVSRRWTQVAMIAMAIAVGTAMGYVTGLGVMIERTERILRREARKRINTSDHFPTEGRALLQEMNASADTPCSEADVASFRRLIMKARYVKEAGRMRGSQLACSASLRPSELPQSQYEPAFREADGIFVYTQIKALHMGALTPIVLRQGDSYVALDPNDRDDTQTSVRFTLTMRNAPAGMNHLGGSVVALSGNKLVQDDSGRTGDSLYATACSIQYPPCITALLSNRQAFLEQRRYLELLTVAGTVVGGCLGFVWLALLRMSRGLEHQLRRAIRRDGLRVVYQPLVNMTTGVVTGAEALVRWTDDDKVAIAPDMFIKVAEARGFVNEITELVVRRVLADFGEYLGTNPEFRINVNVAASDLTDPMFQRMLEGHLWNAGISAQSLGIELTEGATARHEEAIKAIAQLRHRGHKVYIDDFGTGYSSLAYLKDLAVDGIKIDRAFTRAIGTDSVTVGILPQILAMAEVLKLSVVVEGVETEAQHAYFGTPFVPRTGQGWLFGFPVPAGEFRELWLASVADSTPIKAAPRPRRHAGRRGLSDGVIEREVLRGTSV